MYKIQWRRQWSQTLTDGLSKYPSLEAANHQVVIWQSIFRDNEYFVILGD
jgi:hypothetical protein